MNNKFNIKSIQINVFLTLFQVIASGLVFFFLYKYLYETLGTEKIGLWSLLIGITAISRIGEFGLTGGVVKFISEAIHLNQYDRASKIVQTIFISLLVLVSFLILVSYLPVQSILIFVTKNEETYLIKQILPFSFLSIFLMILLGVLSGAFDGTMLMGLKNLLLGFSHGAYLFLVYQMVPLYGLIGVAYAQCVQYFILLILMWSILKREIKELPFLPYRWDFSVIKDMFGYSVNFQAISVVGMLWEPVIKMMMSYWGGLASLGIYEMANKLIVQSRSLITESTRIVVPITAKNSSSESEAVGHVSFVQSTMDVTSFSSFYIFSLLAITVPVISQFWLGSGNSSFIHFTCILLLGYFISTLCSPIFFINLGTGHVKQNLHSYIIMAMTSVIFGNILGFIFGDAGVVYAVSWSLILPALYLGYWYKNYIHDLDFKRLLSVYKFAIILTPVLALISITTSRSFDNIILSIVTLALLAVLSLTMISIFKRLNLSSILLRKA